MTGSPHRVALVVPPRDVPEKKGSRWTEAANLLAVILTAIATVLSAYAALRANEATEGLAALQAVTQFNATINAYPNAGACANMIVRTYDRAKLASLLHKSEFAFEVNEGSKDSASRCLGRKVSAGDKVQVSAEEAREFYRQIFNAFNGYEGILLYWDRHNNSERMLCLEALPGFNQNVRPLIGQMKELASNDDAKDLLATFPALDAFSKTQTCAKGG